MEPKTTISLRAAHPDMPDDVAYGPQRPALPLARVLEDYYEKHPLLRDIPAAVIRDAWFTMAHMLLRPGARVADMGCYDGMMTYAMAALNPAIEFIGVDNDKARIDKAQEKYRLPNLSFRAGYIAHLAGFAEEELDGIINSFTLHEIFSEALYDDRPVVGALENHFALLKPEGIMFIRDFAMPERGAYVLMEMPDAPSYGETLDKLSEADLLVWYSEHARPKEDPGCHGFFLEELPPRFPQTRLFRLPAKWAYEFIMRKDNREDWEDELPKEYTFFTGHEYRKNLRALGARVLYTTPHWDDNFIRNNFAGRFRLLDDDHTVLGPPPTSFIAVAQKMGERMSLRLHERRPSQNAPNKIRVSTMRNDIDGRLIDVVNRDVDLTEIVPYRVTGEGRLHIYVHEGLPRGIVNSVPRQSRNIDQKNWSGHMIEAIAVDSHLVNDIKADDTAQAARFAQDYLGLKAAIGAGLETGQTYYPAPDYIDERITTRYLRVEDTGMAGSQRPVRFGSPDIEGFSDSGRLREIDAQNILNATAVGYVPNTRLELQILMLAETLGLTLESWADCPLVLPEEDEPEGFTTDLKPVAAQMADKDARYRPSRGNAGQWRTVQSTFVDEGRIEGGLRGLKSCDMEFVIPDDGTTNIVAVLPMNRQAVTRELMVGLVADFLPVPQRHKGNGMTVRAPSFALPREIKNLDEMQAFVAEKFGVKIDRVARLGESYFTHAGVTPQRVFPFAVAGMGTWGKTWTGGTTIYAPIRRVRRLLWWDFDETVMYMMQRALLTYGNDSDFGFDRVHRQEMKKLLMEGAGPKTFAMSDIGGLSGYSESEARLTASNATRAIAPAAGARPRKGSHKKTSGGEDTGGGDTAGNGDTTGDTAGGADGGGGAGSGTGGLRMTDALFAGIQGELLPVETLEKCRYKKRHSTVSRSKESHGQKRKPNVN